MIRHHDQDSLEKKEFIGGLQLQRTRVQDHHNGEHDKRQTGMVLEHWLGAYIWTHK